MSQADLLDQDPVFQLKGSMLPVTVLELAHNDLARLDRQLSEKVAQAPNFFRGTPLLLALDKLPDGEGQLDLQGVLDICRRHGMRTLAVRANREEDLRLATMLDIPVLPVSGATRPSTPDTRESAATEQAVRRRARSEKLSEQLVEKAVEGAAAAPAVPATAEAAAMPGADTKPSTEAVAAETADAQATTGQAEPAAVEPPLPEVRPTRMITTPVRSGMQVYAAGGDLIVLAAVSAGAELLADGNIHVYGPMRGRALAGVKGDTSARIFCQQLGAELVSIAGNYKVAEDLRRSPQWGQAVHISLSGDVLNITRL